MDKNNINQILANSLVKEPEIAFEKPSLSYKTSEINDIINRFELASETRQVYTWIMTLLRDTGDFRHLTTPEGMFAQLRNQTKTDEELADIFVRMEQALDTAEALQVQSKLNEKDKHSLEAAIHYCKKSIKERMSSLKLDDKLSPLWHKSLLKKKCNLI